MPSHIKRQTQSNFSPNTKVLELPLQLLPNLTWFQESMRAETIQVNDLIPFQKQTLLSRYSIGGPNNIQWLSIPIQHQTRGLPLNETLIDYHQNWIKDHKHAWQTAYGKTPFFEFYDYRFFQIIDSSIPSLADLSWELLKLLHTSLKMPNKLQRKSTTISNSTENVAHAEEPEMVFHNADTNYPEFAHFTLPYPQIFEQRHGFRYPLSSIDYLFQNYPNF